MFFTFHNSFFYNYKISSKVISYLAKQKRWVCVGGINALRAELVTPLNIQKYPSVMLLKVSPCPLPISVVRVSVGGLIWSQWAFLLLFPSSLSPKNYSSALLVVSNLIFVFILLISIFFLSWTFCRSFICFQFYPSIPIYQILYSSNMVFIL